MLEEILPDVDQIIVMTVNPGFGGQELIPATVEKVARLRQVLEERKLERIAIEVDGAVHAKTIHMLANAGATHVVAGSAVFNARATVSENLKALQVAVTEG